MISGLYSAATAMDASTRRHEIAASNLANVQMPGFRRQMVTQTTFDNIMPPLPGNSDQIYTSKLLGTATNPTTHDFTQGHFEQTERPLDIALTGDGFLTINGPDGPLYTRNGSLYVDTNRQLTTVDNLPVMGAGGPITLPANVNTESIEIARDGRLYANGQEFGQLAIVRFDDNGVLQPAGASLFAVTGDALPLPSPAEVLQGHLELSNTSSIDEMINLIVSSRQQEAAQKALNTIAESVQRRIGLR